jgi:hypothetical protein
MEGGGPKARKNPLLGAAVVKAVLLRQGEGSSSTLYEGLLRDLRLTDEQVEQYLRDHREQVEAALSGHGRRS